MKSDKNKKQKPGKELIDSMGQGMIEGENMSENITPDMVKGDDMEESKTQPQRSKKAANKSRIPDNAREDNSKARMSKESIENSEHKTRKEVNTMRKGREADKGKG